MEGYYTNAGVNHVVLELQGKKDNLDLSTDTYLTSIVENIADFIQHCKEQEGDKLDNERQLRVLLQNSKYLERIYDAISKHDKITSMKSTIDGILEDIREVVKMRAGAFSGNTRIAVEKMANNILSKTSDKPSEKEQNNPNYINDIINLLDGFVKKIYEPLINDGASASSARSASTSGPHSVVLKTIRDQQDFSAKGGARHRRRRSKRSPSRRRRSKRSSSGRRRRRSKRKSSGRKRRRSNRR